MPKQPQKKKTISINMPEGGHAVVCHADWYHISSSGSYMLIDFGYQLNGELLNPIRLVLHLSSAKRFMNPFADFIAKQPDSNFFIADNLVSTFNPTQVVQVTHIEAANRSGNHAEMDFYHMSVAALNRREKDIVKDDVQGIPIARVGMPGEMLTSLLTDFIELLSD